MPPVNQTGSRAGLITALVIFVVAAFAGSGGWVYEHIQHEKEHQEWDAKIAKYEGGAKTGGPVISVADEQSASYQNYKTAQALPENTGARTSVFALIERDAEDLEKRLAGKSGDPQAVLTAANTTMGEASKRASAVGGKLDPAADLVTAVDTLSSDLVRKQDQLNSLKAELAAAQDAAKKVEEKHKAELAERDKAVTAAQEALTLSNTQYKTFQEGQTKTLEEHDTNYKNMLAKAEEDKGGMTSQLTAKATEIEALKKQIAKIEERLSHFRLDTREAMLRKVDGYISKTTGGSTVYINLGSGDQMSQGLTFEVYDQNEGVPKVDNANDDQLPKGKGSIEVINVGLNSSECRIIITAPGQSIAQGDIIANLVYDKNMKLNFFIYPGAGFDLSQSGHPAPGGAAVLKQLVVRWGGTLTEGDHPNINTDFIVMGKEPEMPKGIDPAAAAADPVLQHKIDEAKKAMADYDAIRQIAREYQIPILNQNRFLTYIGYFETARRQGT